jgi:hypothetical protein
VNIRTRQHRQVLKPLVCSQTLSTTTTYHTTPSPQLLQVPSTPFILIVSHGYLHSSSITHIQTQRNLRLSNHFEMDQSTNGKRARGGQEPTGNKRQRTRKTTISVFQIDLKELTGLQNASEAHCRPSQRGPERSFRREAPECQLLLPQRDHWESLLLRITRTSRTLLRRPRTPRRSPTECEVVAQVRVTVRLVRTMEPTSWI